ncbi:MAG: CvpA family protein, partial [Ottowia sp.]|nr:CvpA family protein [Ottowia sp.]
MQTLDFSSTLALLPILDWLALGVLALALAMGAWRGLLYGVISVCGWVGAFLLAGQLGQAVGTQLPLDADARVRAAV